MNQLMLTPAAGKRLIGKAVAAHPAVKRALEKGTIVVIAGTTNACVVEEIQALHGVQGTFRKQRFFRGITLPPNYATTSTGRLADESGFPGDVIIRNGLLVQGKMIDEVAAELKEGDIIIKGANALDVVHKRAAILVGNPQGGTITASLPAVIGRRVKLLLPVGLEKRVTASLDDMANRINEPGERGIRLLPVPGEVVTELEAIEILTGAKAELYAAGGLGGAEGAGWLAVSGTPEQEAEAEKLGKSVAGEPAFGM
jgi:hypothetical protein